MGTSLLGACFLTYLALLCVFNSETLYVVPDNHAVSALCLLVAAAFYGMLFYYLKNSKQPRRNRIEQELRWVEKRQ
jgi:hypothetical protein